MLMLKINKCEENIYKRFNFPDEHAFHTVRKEEKTKDLSRLGSLIGVSLGFITSVALTRKNQPIKDIFVKGDFKKTAKNLWDYTKLDYGGLKGYKYMLLQAAGASMGSLVAASIYDKNSENRIEKTKEAIFVINNVAIPTALAKTVEHILNLNKDSKNAVLRVLSGNKILKNIAVLMGLALGVAASISVTNTINTKIIEPDDKRKKTIKPTDFIAHIDDIIPVLISSKDSALAGLPLDRIMPAIYYILGSKVGKRNYYTFE